jgi:hypothetical protein
MAYHDRDRNVTATQLVVKAALGVVKYLLLASIYDRDLGAVEACKGGPCASMRRCNMQTDAVG